ncbi:18320_t:CDS:2, partial [Gigaspora rosea]
DKTCHYRKIALENNLELVEWYRIYNHQKKNVTLDDIEKVITQQVPDPVLLFWDIESGSMRGPGYLSIGEEENYIFFHIIILDSQEELLLKFTELFKEYSPAFEIGFNARGYDWGFILKKVVKLNIEDVFNKKLFNFTNINTINIFNKKFNNFSKTIEKFQKNVFNLAKNSLKNNFKFTKEDMVDNV